MKLFISILFSFLSFNSIFTQSELIKPYYNSYQLKNLDITKIFVDYPTLIEENRNIENKFNHYEFGIKTISNINFIKNAKKIKKETKYNTFIMNIVSNEATSINFRFDSIELTQEEYILIYDDNLHNIQQIDYSTANKTIYTWPINGNSVWLEFHSKQNNNFKISEIILGKKKLEKNLNNSGNCNYDVNCDFDNMNNIIDYAKNSVALILVQGTTLCSGTLINNTNNDYKPYFLTANHCATPQNAEYLSFRFNWYKDYDNTSCAEIHTSQNPSYINTAQGSIYKASNIKSDFFLVEISDTQFFTINKENLFWAGWSLENIVQLSENTNDYNGLYGIHHPVGDVMKISFDKDTISSDFVQGHYVLKISDWDKGVTQNGSSGSALFNTKSQIVGQLFGGYANCNGFDDNNKEDYYGKFDSSMYLGNDTTNSLKYWISPNYDTTNIEGLPNIKKWLIDIDIIENNDCNINYPKFTIKYNYDCKLINGVKIKINYENKEYQYNINKTISFGDTIQLIPNEILKNELNNKFYLTISIDTNNIDCKKNNIDLINDSSIIDIIQTNNLKLKYEIKTPINSNHQNKIKITAKEYIKEYNFPDKNTIIEDYIDIDKNNCAEIDIIDKYANGFTESNKPYLLIYDLYDNLLYKLNDKENFYHKKIKFISNIYYQNNEIDVFPNPSNKGIFFIILPEGKKIIKIEIYNIDGKLIQLIESNTNSIDISHLAKGIYLAKIIDHQNQIFTRKLVIN